MRWRGRGSTSPRRRCGKSWIWASAQAMFATSCRLISTSTTREGSAISPARRSTFSPPSFARPRTGRASASETAIAPCRSPRSRNGMRSRKRANPGSAFRRCARSPGHATRCCSIPLPGHTRGHCGVAVRRSDDWLLHCGDAYFHHSEVEPGGGAAPKGLRWFESLANVDGAAAARQSGALARARAPRRRRGQAHLLARHRGFRSDEERRAGSSASACACSSASAGRRVARGGASRPAKRHSRCGVTADQSAPVALPLSAFTAPRRVFSSTRRTREASVGRVARRRFGRACAFTSKSVSRARASSRLRGWLAKLWAKMTITPSWVARDPASLISRIATSFGRLGGRGRRTEARPRSPPC